MTFDSKEITRTIRNAIARSAREYLLRSNNLPDYLGIPEYLHNVRIYDALWTKLNAKDTIRSGTRRLCITIEERTEDVKWYTEKRGPTSEILAGNKKHDVCLWIVDRPICVIEVKLFSNRYDVFDKDVKRLEAAVRGKQAPDFNVLAFHGFRGYTRDEVMTHQEKISNRFSRNHCVEIREFQLKETKQRYIAGTITVFNRRSR